MFYKPSFIEVTMYPTHARSIVPATKLVMQEPEELFEVTAQCLMSGQDRDAISGWGAIIHVM